VTLKDSPLVFVGYGIVAPEYKWNDYTGLDVKGKTVVVLVNDPGHVDASLFDGKAMTYYGRWTYKYEEAARQGAAGILIVHDTEPAGYPWEVVHGSWTGPLEELQPDGGYQLAIQGWVSHDSAEKLFAAAGMKFDEAMAAAAKPGFKAIPLKLDAGITLHDTVKDIVSHNVVGLVKGSTHPENVVVYSAHWDHLGMRTGPDGKAQIFHGAIDNGSGIAGLLEIARLTAQSKPQRSVLFLATTSEEQGLLGAAYYAAHPLFPLAHTVADLNMDVLDTYGKTRDVTVRGRFMSGVDDVFQAQAKSLGLVVEQDSDPAKGMYFRADHFEFAKAGVPAMSIALGTDYVGHPVGWGLEQQKGYTANRYHKPADVYEPGWDLAGMQQQLQLMYLTGQALADSDQWPTWKPGTPFKAKRDAQKP
jgi:Zn-dependent M28 family amino/carboxypeptidase